MLLRGRGRAVPEEDASGPGDRPVCAGVPPRSQRLLQRRRVSCGRGDLRPLRSPRSETGSSAAVGGAVPASVCGVPAVRASLPTFPPERALR